MAEIIKSISLDVIRHEPTPRIMTKQFDRDSRFLNIRLKSDGRKINANKSSLVVINAQRPDGEAKAFEGVISEDGTVTVPITYWMSELEGTVKCDISLFEENGSKLTTQTFLIHVIKANYNGEEISEEDQKDFLSQMAESALEAKAGAKAAESALQKAERFFIISKNLLNPDTMESGFYISSATGDKIAMADKKCTDYIEAKPDTAYIYSDTSDSYAGTMWAFYDIDKQFVGGQTGGQSVMTPAHTAYIRLSVSVGRVNMQLEEGITATEYEAYTDTKLSADYIDAYSKKESDAKLDALKFLIGDENASSPLAQADQSLLALKEIYLEGVEQNRELFLKQLRKDYFDGNVYSTTLIVTYADDTEKEIARFSVSGSDKANYTGKRLIRLEPYYSTVRGYAFIDYDALKDGTSFWKGAALDKYNVTHLAKAPNINQYLLSLGAYDGIVKLNKDKESFVINAAKSRSDRFHNPYTPLEFVHFSDIHAQKTEWKRIVDYIDHYEPYIRFALHTGDICGSSLASAGALYDNARPKHVPIFNAVGNHDTYLSDESMTADGVTQEAIKSVVFENTSGWDVTFGTEAHAMYYYKDFADSNIRLIVLNDQHFTNAQATWFTNVLNDAKMTGKAVITASHMMTARIKKDLSCGFVPADHYAEVVTFPTQAFEAQISAFKTAGGTHVCHLCGHAHYDHIGYTDAGILNITVECATHYNAHTESQREKGTKTFDAFNVVTVDVNTNRLKVIRIGNDTSASMKKKTAICYDYAEKKMVSEYELADGNATTITVDATLTREGMAADAKAVGDKLTSAIEKLVIGGGKNLVDPDTFTYGYYVRASTGVLTAASGKKSSDYIAVEPNANYFYSDTSNSYAGLYFAFYDAAKSYISGGNSTQSMLTPEGASYVRFSVTDTRSNMQLEKGTVATAFEAYMGKKRIREELVNAYTKEETDRKLGSLLCKELQELLSEAGTISYYDDLNTCIANVNAGTTNGSAKADTNACCTYTNQDGTAVIVLLKDIETTSAFTTITVPVILHLADRMIKCNLSNATEVTSIFSFTGAHAKVNGSFGGKVTVTSGAKATTIFHAKADAKTFALHGGEYELNGGTADLQVIAYLSASLSNEVKQAKFAISSQTPSTVACLLVNSSAVIEHCDIYAEGFGNAFGIYAQKTCDYNFIRNCNIYAATHTETGGYGVGIYAKGNEVIENCTIFGDGSNNSTDVGGMGRGINCNGGDHPISIRGCIIEGTQTGASIAGKGCMIANSALYSCSHGGFYAMNGSTVYIESSVLGCREYHGQFDFSQMTNGFLGDFYIGGSSNATDITVYMDHCTLTALGEYCGTMRGAGGEYGNTLYISNTTMPNGKNFRVDGNNTLVAGVGMNIDFSTVTDLYPVDGGNHLLTSEYAYAKANVYANTLFEQMKTRMASV